MVRSVEYSPDGKWLATIGVDKTIILGDTTNGRQKRELKGHSGGVRCIAFSSDGSRLASSSDDQTIKIWGTDPD